MKKSNNEERKKVKKMKCYVCGENEKEVPERVVRYYCWKCVANNSAFKVMYSEKFNNL